jgi:hypothetical protein
MKENVGLYTGRFSVSTAGVVEGQRRRKRRGGPERKFCHLEN